MLPASMHCTDSEDSDVARLGALYGSVIPYTPSASALHVCESISGQIISNPFRPEQQWELKHTIINFFLIFRQVNF